MKSGAARSSRVAMSDLQIASRVRAVLDLERLAERGVRLVGADLHDGAQRVTLHRRLGVVEQRRRDRAARRRRQTRAAVRPRCGAPPDWPSSAARRRSARPAAPKLKSTSRSRLTAEPCSAGERLGERTDDASARAPGRTPRSRSISSSSRLADEQDDVLHQRPAAQAVEPGARGRGKRPPSWPARENRVEQLLRQRHVADEHELLDRGDRRVEDLAPRVGAGLDGQQVEQHLLIEPPDFLLADRRRATR